MPGHLRCRAPGRTRTCDLLLWRQSLYPLGDEGVGIIVGRRQLVLPELALTPGRPVETKSVIARSFGGSARGQEFPPCQLFTG